MPQYTARVCKFSDSDSQDVARDYFRMYAKYQAEVNPTSEKSVPDFGTFFKQWDNAGMVICLLFCDSTPIGFQTAYRIGGAMLGHKDSYAIGACYTEPEYRTVYKMTLVAGKQFAQSLKSLGGECVTVALPHKRAIRLQRVCSVAVSEVSRGFEI